LSANLTGSFPYLKSLKFIHCSPLTPKWEVSLLGQT
jgi:hypothetical protein